MGWDGIIDDVVKRFEKERMLTNRISTISVRKVFPYYFFFQRAYISNFPGDQ